MEKMPETRNRRACKSITNIQKEKKIKIGNLKTIKKVKKIKIGNMTFLKEGEKSDYEKMIQLNREKSLAFLESLKIEEVKESFREGVRILKPKRVHVLRPLPPRRKKSGRVTKKVLDLSERAVLLRALEEANRIKEREKEIAKEHRAYTFLKKELRSKAKLENQYRKEPLKVFTFECVLKGKEMFSDFSHDFSGLNYKEIKRTYEIPSHFKSMKTCESQIAKIVPARITAIAIHPVRDKIIIAAASELGHIGLWNMNSASNPYVFAPHNECTTNLRFNPFDSNQIVSSSLDGGLKCGDIEMGFFHEVYSAKNRMRCTYFDILSKSTFIVAHQDGRVAIVDDRTSKTTVIRKHFCSVESVSIHPRNRNYFISSSCMNELKLWDLRKLRPVFNVRQHTRSVTSAFFSPATGNSILSTSLDNSLCIFDSSNLKGGISLKKLIKHKTFLDEQSHLKATWVPNTDDTFVVGSMLDKRILVFNDNGKKIYNFMSEDLNSITSLHAFHPSLPVLAGGDSSGKVFVFTDNV